MGLPQPDSQDPSSSRGRRHSTRNQPGPTAGRRPHRQQQASTEPVQVSQGLPVAYGPVVSRCRCKRLVCRNGISTLTRHAASRSLNAKRYLLKHPRSQTNPSSPRNGVRFLREIRARSKPPSRSFATKQTPPRDRNSSPRPAIPKKT